MGATSLSGVSFDGTASSCASAASKSQRDLMGTELTPIDVLLGRQAEMTPVERFARLHEDDLVPAGERWWSDRLPTAMPEAGQQYAFAVDLDSCTGCKACVSACNSLNGLDGDEQWRTVTTIHGTTPDGPSVLTVTAACHHCVDPACMNGCPVDAYEKDPVTGIVAHLDDQCIGCSYCTLTCPYEVPLYNSTLGIVRKCDMCRGRLAEGEAPACVQGCPNGAITITVVDVTEVRDELDRELAALVNGGAHDPLEGSDADGGDGAEDDGAEDDGAEGDGAADDGAEDDGAEDDEASEKVGAQERRRPDDRPRLVPGAPDSTLTVPTTRYRSSRVADGAFADHRVVKPGHAHTPLAVMLTLTQVAVGTTVVDAAVHTFAPHHATRSVPGLALAVALVALAASIGHLGRPLYAWRAVIGFRHSWLSREIVAFGAFAGSGLAYAGAVFVDLDEVLVTLLRLSTVLAGLAGVACSVVLYAVTGRAWWRIRTSAVRFTGTMVGAGALLVASATLAGAVGSAGSGSVDSGPVELVRSLLVTVVASTIVSLLAATYLLRPRPQTTPTPKLRISFPTGGDHVRNFAGNGRRGVDDLAATRHLLLGPLSTLLRARIAAALVGGVAMPLLVLCILSSAGSAGSTDSTGSVGWMAPAALAAAFAVFVIGELIDRRLFFLGSVAPRRYGDSR